MRTLVWEDEVAEDEADGFGSRARKRICLHNPETCICEGSEDPTGQDGEDGIDYDEYVAWREWAEMYLSWMDSDKRTK